MGEGIMTLMDQQADLLEEAANQMAGTVDADAMKLDPTSGVALTIAATADEAINIGTNANVVGSGINLQRATYTAAFRVYSDDGGVVLTGTGSVPDIRGALSRTLLTIDNTGGNIRVHALMGHLKSYDGFWNGEQVNAVHGRMEIQDTSAASVVLGGYGITAAVGGTVCTTGTITVNTYHVLAGLAAIADIRATLTQTGKVVGVYVGKYDTTNWSDATSRANWGYGLYIDEDSITNCPIQVGKFVASAAVGGGFAVTATYSAAMRIYSEVATDLTSAAMVRSILGRMLISGATEITQNAECFGTVGQVVCAQATIRHDSAGVLGSFEGQTTHIHIDGTDGDNVAAGVLGRVGVSISSSTVTASGILAGVAAMSNITSAAVTVSAGGILAGLHVGRFSGKQVWDIGLNIDTTACTIPIQLGVDADGVPVVIICGNFADGGASGYGHGSIGLDTTDGLLMYADTNKAWQAIAAS